MLFTRPNKIPHSIRGLDTRFATNLSSRSTCWPKALQGSVLFSRRISLKSTKLRDTIKNSSKTTNLNNPLSIHPSTPARTRFAPSPTGFVHLGSLRTALYNYLLAKQTKGQFLLRLEDTDQNRLVPGAEQNIYDSLRWAGLSWDEGPDVVGGQYGPYRQSERSSIYKEYSDKLIQSGHAYRCFCSKDRLDTLRDSARKLHPPSMASYDRKCANLSKEESDSRAQSGAEPYTVRFKSPIEYPKFRDLLHGQLDLQTQVNFQDLRYEDPVLVKSDGLPTYHLANVVDDHLMKITHVIRGEEWLLSAPKHVALYEAFGWQPPQFAHIPLLTSKTGDKKLSKRSGDAGISHLATSRGILPEALVNFVALFGWSPPSSAKAETGATSESEVFTLKQLEEIFTLDGLTKGNAKVDDKKLDYFNQVYFKRLLDSSSASREKIIEECLEQVQPHVASTYTDIPDSIRSSRQYTDRLLTLVSERISSVSEFKLLTEYFYKYPDWARAAEGLSGPDAASTKQILLDAADLYSKAADQKSPLQFSDLMKQLSGQYPRKQVFKALRFALAGSVSGLKIPDIAQVLGPEVTRHRITKCVESL